MNIKVDNVSEDIKQQLDDIIDNDNDLECGKLRGDNGAGDWLHYSLSYTESF